MSTLSRNLSWEEVLRGSGYEAGECPQDVLGAMYRHAFTCWQEIRYEWGDVLRIPSGGGLRTEAKQDECNPSARARRHVVGDATDIKIAKGRPNRDYLALYDLIKAMQKDGRIPKGGLAAYWSKKKRRIRFLHVDSRGVKARWKRSHLKKARSYYA